MTLELSESLYAEIFAYSFFGCIKVLEESYKNQWVARFTDVIGRKDNVFSPFYPIPQTVELQPITD